MLMRFLFHWITLAVALYIVSLIPIFGITFDTTHSLIWAALALIIANTIIKPILVFISLPLVVLTLGLFLLIINAIILYTLPDFVSGFHVPSLISAFFASIVLSIITSLFGGWDRSSRRTARTSARSGEVIDV